MRRVAIVARGGTSALAPYWDRGWEIWGLPWISYPRLDRAFEMHAEACRPHMGEWYRKPDWIIEHEARAPDVPVYCDPSRLHAFKNAVEYPLGEVIAGLPIPTLENSIAYMVALAIHEGVDEIGLWGVHLWAHEEAELALASVSYLIGLAQGKGITVTIPPGSPLLMSNFTAGRYGVNAGPASRRPKFLSVAGANLSN